MLLEHASYAYPSEIVLGVELGLVAILGLLLAVAPRLVAGRVDAGWAALEALARRPAAATLAVLVVAGGGNALTHRILGPPIPVVPDEAAYVLQAETFAAGRWTNPPPPLPDTVRMDHVLDRPTRQSKYPPAQGLLLAVGAAFGRLEASLALGAALLGVGTLWALRAWLPPAWALAGSLLVAVHLGIGSYWSQSYWGGVPAALGGALLLGALGRWRRDGPQPLHAIPVVAGLALLANSRPFEGLLFALACAVPFATALRGLGSAAERLRAARAIGGILGGLIAVGVAMGHYHRAVTGDPLLLPHLFFTASRLPGHAHFLDFEPSLRFLATIASRGIERLALDLRFFAGLLLAPAALLGPLVDPRVRWPALATAAVVLGHFFVRPWHVHYAAPAAIAVVLLALAGARGAHRSFRGADLGRWATLSTLPIFVVLAAVELPAHRPDPGSAARLRLEWTERLEREPRPDLVLVPPDASNVWRVNGPSLDEAEILWARDLDPERTRALRALHPDRRVWRVLLEPRPRLVPVP